ncbi:MAG TPA: glutathione S-transferase family protein [Alphaproteobacteria bacterium]|nr:glutathione S-transferase family protein [Alphaproteobacteria bacterium]
MYKLYYAPGACSMAIHVALNECSQPVQLEKIDIRAPRPPEFLKINPRGQVPVLVEDGAVLREGAAILIHVLEKHQNPLLPKSGPARDAALEWLMFCNATLHPAYSRCFFLMRNAKDEAAKEHLLGVAMAMVDKLWAEVEDRLGAHAFLAGDEITIADILMTVIANWGDHLPARPAIGPHTRKLLQTVIARPAYKKALETEKVEYKAAA